MREFLAEIGVWLICTPALRTALQPTDTVDRDFLELKQATAELTRHPVNGLKDNIDPAQLSK